MSYSFKWHGLVTDAVKGVASVNDGLVQDPDNVAAVEDHRAVALAAVSAFVDQLGPGYGELSVQVTGHANPDHVPTRGWADDMLTVTVQAIKRASEP